MTERQIPMGAGLLPPQHTVAVADPGAGDRPAGPAADLGQRRLLGALATASPLLFTVYLALDPAPLPREPAGEFLGAIAGSRGQYVAAASVQLAAMVTGLALAVAVALAFRDSSRRLSVVAAGALALGYLGGAGFVGAKLVAADLVADGRVRPGAEETWTTVHGGPLFDVMSWPLLCALLGAVLVTAVLVRARAQISWWPAVVYLVGFVLSSGELPDAAAVAGSAAQVVVALVVARRLLRPERS